MTTDWQRIRADYPLLTDVAYLDTACKGLPSASAEAALQQHIARLRNPPSMSTTDETIAMLTAFAEARSAVAELINATPEEVALTPSTESGISALADALRFEPGTNVLASDLEFVGTVLPWTARGVDVRFVPHRNGVIAAEGFESFIDAQTRAVVISAVQEVNGFEIDLDAFTSLCRDHSMLLIIDGIQLVGPRQIDVSATGIDAMAVGGHKWLGAPFGMGFTYVARRIHEGLAPRSNAFMTALPPGSGWSKYLESPHRRPDDALNFPRDARQLETAALGTTLAAAGLAAAVRTLLTIGPDAVAERSKELAAYAVDALQDVGATVVTPGGSTIVTFAVSDDLGEHRSLVAVLERNGIATSLRGTTGVFGIRASPYFYNDAGDIDRLRAAVGAFSEQKRMRTPR